MKCWCVSKIKSWFYSLLMLMMIFILMVCRIQGGCIEEEKKTLLEIKTSLIDLYVPQVDPLPSWVDDGNPGGKCCDWERVKCNITTGHITDLSLRNMMVGCKGIWPLNVSMFLNFKELASLDLSSNCLDSGIMKTELGRLSSLNKLEMLDLSDNSIGNGIFSSLGALTSLRVLHLGYSDLEGYFPAFALDNLEILDLTNNKMQGFERVSELKKLKILNLGSNKFNENLIKTLSALPSLKSLDLNANKLFGFSFPAEELAHITSVEELDLSNNKFNDTPSIQECTRLSKLKNLKSVTLRENHFNKSIISCLRALPSLKTLDLSDNPSLGTSFPIQGMF